LFRERGGLTESSATTRIRSDSGISTSESSDLFRLLVNSVRDFAIFVLDPDGHVLTWNLGAQALKGYAKEEIIGKHFSQFYLPEAVQSGWPQRELGIAKKEGRFADEGWRIRKDGSSFWASVIITALRESDGKLCGFAKVTQDMTDRRQNEERIQSLNRELRLRISQLDEIQRVVQLRTIELQKLSGRLLQVQDEERRRLARELHDELGQQLAGLKMMLKKATSQEAEQMVDTAIASVRNLSYILHPPLLDETGLQSALHWYVDGLAKRSGIEISLLLKPQNFPRLSSEIEATIFRIVQEALTNVYKHSGTEKARVEVEIDKYGEMIFIKIRDYGKGFPLENMGSIPMPSMGIGIGGMRERVRQFGGELLVTRAEPGALVEVKIPLFGGAVQEL